MLKLVFTNLKCLHIFTQFATGTNKKSNSADQSEFPLCFASQTSALRWFVCENQSVPTLLYIWLTYTSCRVVILKVSLLWVPLHVFWRCSLINGALILRPTFSLQEFTCTPCFSQVSQPFVVDSWRIFKCIRLMTQGAVRQCHPQTGDLGRVRLCFSLHCWVWPE